MGKAGRKKERQEDKIPPAALTSLPQQPPWFSRYGWLIPPLLALLVNVNVLHTGVVWDDNLYLEEQIDQEQESPQPAIATQEQAYQGPAITPQAYYRPIIELSVSLDKAIWGSNPFGFHLSVYLAHAMTTLMFYGCLIRLLDLYRQERGIALVAASLFAVHPIHVETVAWIAGRNDVYTALFILIAFYAYLRYRQQPASWKMLPLFGLGSVLGLLSKETAIPFLLIFPVLDFLFHRSGLVPWRGMKDPLLRIWIAVLSVFVIYRLSRVGLPPAHVAGAASSGSSILPLFITLGYYLKLLFIPHPLNLFIARLPTGNIQTLEFLLIGAFGFFGIVWLLFRQSRTVWAVGSIWFLLGLAAPLVVPWVNVSATPVAERYAYLASAGFLLLISLGAYECRRVLAEKQFDARWILISLGLVVGLFSYLTFARNQVWRDEVTIWKDTIQKSPQASFPHFNLGLVYEKKLKRFDEAIREYQAGLKISSNNTAARHRLANLFAEKGLSKEAQKEYQVLSTLQPDSASTHYNLGVVLSKQEREAEAIQEYQAAIRLNPDHMNAHYNLGLAYANQGRFQEAIAEFQTVVRLKPDDAAAHAVLGDIYKDQGKEKEAIDEYQAALRLDSDQVEIHYNLGLVYGRAGRLEDAKKQYQQALQIKPDFLPARKALLSLPKE